MSSIPEFAAGIYRILNLATNEYVLRGNLNEPLRTGPLGGNTATKAVSTKVFRVTQVGDNAQLFSEVAGLKPVPSASAQSTIFGSFTNNQFQPDLREVIWGRFDAQWVFRATGPGQLNFGRIPEQLNTFWADVQHTVYLQPIGPFSNWRLVSANEAEAEAK
ncbi:hypothetical protein Clacol_004040 [Clathrus columnatus]|uniref:Uncharacterized protein n=1 Tax=Clathrus columnatus TaxID=1419009 RepID=A0AAV5ABG4_9AGAM|nr:hypothetical protein Clacol_004040 [Clathrus columnatus]